MGKPHPIMRELKTRRKFARLSQVDAGKKIGWGDNALRSWERGEVQPPLRALVAYAGLFGLELRLEVADEPSQG